METLPKTENFITTVDLSIQLEENVYQFLYGSQLYGTSFALYGRFDCSPLENTHIKINKIRFQLINYRGCVNIGLIGQPKYGKRNGQHVIVIYVKPLQSSAEPIDFDFEGEGLIINEGDRINFQRLAKPFDSRLKEENNSGYSQNEIFFDTEFNYRDGYFESPEPLRPGHIDYSGPQQPWPSPRCHFSVVKVKI